MMEAENSIILIVTCSLEARFLQLQEDKLPCFSAVLFFLQLQRWVDSQPGAASGQGGPWGFHGVEVHQALDCSIVRSFIPCHLVTTDACHLTVA